jgi:hypothetical protein
LDSKTGLKISLDGMMGEEVWLVTQQLFIQKITKELLLL